ncbi:MAG: hypothetical protein GEU94_02740 [Micromonosporaceae bacterium]|nr:hypothetical protein [Micromonosporaceae bacterium]
MIAGFAAGGALIAVLSPRAALLVCAGLDLVAALIFRYGLIRRAPRAVGRPSIGQTWRVNRQLWSHRARRAVYLALWVPNGLVVGCEALFMPYAGESAGVLFIAGALGMLAGDTLAGRFIPPGWRRGLELPLRMLLAAPYLLFALMLPLPVAVVAVTIASVGFAASLLLQERLIALTPPDVKGQALGLHSSGMLTMQAVGATLAGAVAEVLGAGAAMAVMAGASLLVTAALIRPLRAPAPRPDVAETSALGSGA